MRSMSRVALVSIGGGLAALFALSLHADAACSFVECWPQVPEGQRFVMPWGIAVDAGDGVLVTDINRGEIKRFDSSGNLLASWGSRGSGDGEFLGPHGIAADSSGNVFVADTYNNRVQKFDNSGNFLTKWGSQGHGDGEFLNPYGVAVDLSGNVFVSDSSKNRIQKFDNSGNFLSKWGSDGSENGQFQGPHGIAVDSSGNVLVCDIGNNRVQKFDSSGGFLAAWGDGELLWPYAVAEGPGGNIWVADSGHLRVQIYDTSGNPIATYGSEGCGGGQFGRPQAVVPGGGPADLAFDSSGDVFVTDPYNRRIQKLSSVRAFIGKWGYAGDAAGDFCRPEGIAVRSIFADSILMEAFVFVADTWNNRVQRFDKSGNLVVWGAEGSGEGEFRRPRGIAVRSDNVFVADTDNHRVQKFDFDGSFLLEWGSQGDGDGQFDRPCEIAVDPSGNVFVADTENTRVQKFDSNGSFLTKWGSAGTNDGEFGPDGPIVDGTSPLGPQGIAVDSSGEVYVADTWNNRIQVFDASGQFLRKWDCPRPTGVAADSWGRVFVAGNNIQMYHSSGSLLYGWGDTGIANGELMSPRGIAVDGRGNVFVADTQNSRIQKFQRDFAIERITRSGDLFTVEFYLTGETYYEIWGTMDNPRWLAWAPLIGVGRPYPVWGVHSWTDDGQHMLGPSFFSERRFYRVEVWRQQPG